MAILTCQRSAAQKRRNHTEILYEDSHPAGLATGALSSGHPIESFRSNVGGDHSISAPKIAGLWPCCACLVGVDDERERQRGAE